MSRSGELDPPVVPHVRARMANTRGRDTKPELAVRRALHARGWRYRVNARPVADLRRTGDLVFTKRRVVVLIDGCFWHGCPEHYVIPKTRTQWWQDKIEGNRRKDVETAAAWAKADWTVLRFWEHEPVERIVEAIETTLVQADGAPLQTTTEGVSEQRSGGL